MSDYIHFYVENKRVFCSITNAILNKTDDKIMLSIDDYAKFTDGIVRPLFRMNNVIIFPNFSKDIANIVYSDMFDCFL